MKKTAKRSSVSARKRQALKQKKIRAEVSEWDLHLLRTGKDLIDQLASFRAELAQCRSSLNVLHGEMKQTGSASHSQLFWGLIRERDEMKLAKAIEDSARAHARAVAEAVGSSIHWEHEGTTLCGLPYQETGGSYRWPAGMHDTLPPQITCRLCSDEAARLYAQRLDRNRAAVPPTNAAARPVAEHPAEHLGLPELARDRDAVPAVLNVPGAVGPDNDRDR